MMRLTLPPVLCACCYALSRLVARHMQACDGPLSRGNVEHSAAAPPGCPPLLAGLDTPDGCARALLARLGEREGEAARRRATELGASLAVVIESGAFGDTLPSSADALTGAYVAALRRCSARVALHGTVPPSHAALLAAEGCLLHKAHAALLGASVAATCEANLEFREGCSLLAARIATPQELDLAPALAHLAEMQSCTLPLAKLLCLRQCAAAAVRANAGGAVEGSGADQLMPLLLLLLSRGGVPDVLAHIHFAESFFLINGCGSEDDPRKGRAVHPGVPAPPAPAKAATPGRAAVKQSRHSRHPSAPAMLELVSLQPGDAAVAQPGDEADERCRSPFPDAKLGRWASPFARWRARAPSESPGQT